MAVHTGRVNLSQLGLLLSVALVSAATLGVQVLETRLFSVMLWHHLTYMVVTVTLLGFAASGSLLAMAPRLARLGGEPRVAVSLYATGFAWTLAGVFALAVRDPLDTLDVERDRTLYFWLCARYAYLVLPFSCAGLAVATALQTAASVYRAYVWNMVGTSAGTLLFVVSIRPLGGAGSLLFFAALGGAAGVAAVAGVSGGRARAARVLGGLTLIVCGAGAASADLAQAWLPIRPARSKALSVLENLYAATEQARSARDPAWPGPDPAHRQTVWGPLCRIDSVPVPREPGDVIRDAADPAHAPRSQVHLFQDGDAPTVMWSRGYARERDHRASPYALGYDLLAHPDVLVIGPGGGNDVQTALQAGARRVTAVEINGDTLALLRGPFAGYTGHLYDRPDVEVVHAEGRSYLRRQGDRRFDLIVMSGTDTYAALASGSYVFSESYLYTVEAFDDFFAHLREDGLVHVLRFRFEPPREELRLVATAAQALARLGVGDPRRHFVIVDQEDRQALAARAALAAAAASDPHAARMAAALAEFAREPMRYGVTLIRKRPFTPAEVKVLAAAIPALDQNPAVTHTMVYDADAGVAPGSSMTAYGRLLAAFAAGDPAAFYAAYPYRVAPATDDRPFFFSFYHWKDLVVPRARDATSYAALTGSEPIGLHVLAALALQTLLATVLLVLAPLARLRAGRGTGRPRALVHFACLGAGYFLVEIATIQRFVLYLGHPTWSLVANLTTFLACSGAGAAAAGRLRCGRRGAAVACAAVVVLLAGHAYALPPLLHASLAAPDGQRVLASVGAIAPLAFCMGIPFAVGLARVRAAAPEFLPWALSVNGSASVLSSVLAIVLAMELGFTAVLALAGLAYAVAMLTVPRVPVAPT